MASEARPATCASGAAVLVLASASTSRAALLAGAGVPAMVIPAQIDEDAMKTSLRADGADAGVCAERLSELKARRVAADHPGALVLGADQLLECDGIWFDKPCDRAEAHAQLLRLRGRTHRLFTAACVVERGRRTWDHLAVPTLTMRDFSEVFAQSYLDQVGARAFESVGAYQIEGPGAQLFARICGDHFAIRGLPLVPLLAFLRARGLVAT